MIRFSLNQLWYQKLSKKSVSLTETGLDILYKSYSLLLINCTNFLNNFHFNNFNIFSFIQNKCRLNNMTYDSVV